MEMTMTDARRLGVALFTSNPNFALAKDLARELSRPAIVAAPERRTILTILAHQPNQEEAIAVLTELLGPLTLEFRLELLNEQNACGETAWDQATKMGHTKTAACLQDLLKP
ncbi:MAG: hypothetical protein EBR79_02895 [Proteobacteria bacterium]|nr:hypothetical protein [Pseudomonadota bacterium]